MELFSKIPPFKYISRSIENFLDRRETSPMRRQRLVVLLYSVCILAGIVPIQMVTCVAVHPVLVWLKFGLWLFAAVLMTLYLCRKLSLDATISTLTLIIQSEKAAEIAYCSTIDSPYASPLLMENLFLAVVVVLLAAMAYLKHLPYLLSAMVLSAYCYSMVVMDNSFMKEFCPAFFFIFFIICLSSSRIYHCTDKLETENSDMREDEQEIQWLLRMDKQQVKAFVALSKSREGDGTTGRLLDMVGERARRNIIEAVSAYQKQQSMTTARVRRACPELTPSEAEICAMILQDKRQNDICIRLGKSASNINSQRSHIRRKLALAPADDLKEVLLRRMADA